jgi:uncharacterized protein involved in exopolysaccharide biosynthesis
VGIQEVLKYLKIIRKWWWVLVLLLGATVGTMLALAILTETQYEAIVTVQISAPPPEEVPLYSDFGRQAVNDEIALTRTSFSELLLEGDIVYRTLETLPDIQMRGGELRDRITIDTPESVQLVRIHVRVADPETAALLANTVVEVGLQRYGELRAQSTVNTRQFIEQELEIVRVELKVAETELTQFQIANKFKTLDEAVGNQDSLIRQLRMQSDLAQAEGDTAKAQALEELLLEREAELQNLIGLSAEYNELFERVERTRATHDFLLDRWSESRIKENQILEVGFIQVITPARPPNNPVAAISNKLIVLGAVVSLLVGVLLTFLLEYLEISGVFSGLQKLSEQHEKVALTESASRQTAI